MPVYEYRCRQCEEVFGHLFRTLREAEEKKPRRAQPAVPAGHSG